MTIYWVGATVKTGMTIYWVGAIVNKIFIGQ